MRMDKPVLTEEQIRFFSNETAKAYQKGAQRTLRKAYAGYLALFIGTMLVYLNGQSVSENERAEIRNDGRVVAINSCNARYVDRTEIRDVLEQSKRAVQRQYSAGIIDKAQSERSIKFYDERLKNLPLPDCRKADDALEVQDQNLPIPEARYPGDGKDL